jgi:hypothetical protein
MIFGLTARKRAGAKVAVRFAAAFQLCHPERSAKRVVEGAALTIALTLLGFAPAAAALQADPTVLYAQMQDAYAKGTAHNWTYRDQAYYYATILNAGRAYSLQHPDDPAYVDLANLTVQIGAALHYNPLTNHDGAVWWVREAAVYVQRHSDDPTLIAQAGTILSRTNTDDPAQLAAYADEDASALLQQYPRDTDALNTQLEADWRSWILTKDPKWRALALQRVSQPYFPIANLPTGFGEDVVNSARSAKANVAGYSEAERANATAFLKRYDKLGKLRTIASVNGQSHAGLMGTLAPADEYFGPLQVSVLGMRNQLDRLNKMLDLGWGDRISGDAVNLEVAIDDLHKVYPRDRDLPKLLAGVYALLGRFGTTEAHQAAVQAKLMLTVEYPDTPQGREFLQNG